MESIMSTLKKLAASCLALALCLGVLSGCMSSLQGAESTPTKSTNSGLALNSAQPNGGLAGAPSATPSESDGSSPSNDYLPYNDFSDEEYALITEQGFYSTLARPLSTFSSDVDTASYANLRRMIKSGAGLGDIPVDAVRIEEMLNYFSYDYATPASNELFGMTSQVADCPWNPDTKLLIMGFSTEKIDYSQIAGSNLVFLVDVSGSMSSSDKLPLLQDSFDILIEGLNANDRVSIVTYAGQERVICEGVPGSEKAKLSSAIHSLKAEGSTNGQAGLQTAYDIAQKFFIEGGNNRIIMASDGDLNVGIRSTSDLYNYVTQQRASGVYLSVLGFGTGNYKDAKMETLADHGNGAYYYIDCIEEAQKVFGEDLCGNLVTLAKDVKLQVEFNPEHVKGYRLIGYENRAMTDQDFNNAAADAGEIGWGHQITVAYELVMADSKIDIPIPELKYQNSDPALSGSSEWLTCTVRYKDPATDEGSEDRYTIAAESYTATPSADWNFAAAVIETGMIIRDSGHRGSASLDQASRLLDNANLEDSYKKEFAELMQLLG